ncbi:MAG: cyclic peptide export ABC transporter, partial [Bacteroidota bacterium]
WAGSFWASSARGAGCRDWSIELSQRLYWRLRMEILQLLLRADYQQLYRKENKIHSALLYDIGALVQASLSIIEFMTSSVIVLACLIYMASLSVSLFAITLLTASSGILVYNIRARHHNRQFEITRDLEDGFMKKFNDLLYGFKEVYMDRRKGTEIMDRHIRGIAKRAYDNNTKAYIGFLNNQITGTVLFYLLIASIMLFFSIWLEIEAATTVSFLFILLYLLSSIETIMVLLPGFARAKISLDRLTGLKSELEGADQVVQEVSHRMSIDEFENIVMRDIVFAYDGKEGEQSFRIGPIGLEVTKGETLFIYGGNGSGKTTLVYALLGLLKAHSGSIHFNGRRLDAQSFADYKALFSVVFSDFYLFDEIYGKPNFDRSAAQDYLQLFEIDDKVQIVERGFSSIDLSTGQKKRLALISALLEERPLLVLDEWAADQDPHFRKKFYEQIIPQINEKGVSIVAITHDDAYYHCADRLYKMEYGQLKDESLLLQQQVLTLKAE